MTEVTAEEALRSRLNYLDARPSVPINPGSRENIIHQISISPHQVKHIQDIQVDKDGNLYYTRTFRYTHLDNRRLIIDDERP